MSRNWVSSVHSVSVLKYEWLRTETKSKPTLQHRSRRAIHSRRHSSEMASKRSSSSSSTGNGLQGGRTLAVCTTGDTLLSRKRRFATEAPTMRLYFSWGRLYIAASNLVRLRLSPVLNVRVEQLSGFEPWSSLRNVWTQFYQRTPWMMKL